MNVDLRGFRFAFEPLLRRERWQLDALQARLGALHAEIRDARQVLQIQHAELAHQNALLSAALAQRMNPMLHGRCLQWLARLREDIIQQQEALQALNEERQRLTAECAARRNKLSVIEKHREGCVAEYSQELANRQAAAADRDWLARSWQSSCQGAPEGSAP